MKQNMQDLTKGSIWKKTLIFSFPLILSNLLQVLFNIADVAVVGRFAGSQALGSVGSTTTLVTLFITFLMGIGSGINVLTARFYGSKDYKELSETIHTALIFCIIAGIVVLAAGQLSFNTILNLLNTKSELIDDAVLYLRIYFFAMPALAVYNFGNAVLSAAGDTKTPLYFLSLSGVVNIILNLYFVIVCHMSVAGVAIASVISQYLSAFLIIIVLFRSKCPYAINIHSIHINKDKCKQLLYLCIPAGIQNSIFQLANLFIQGGVNTFDANMVSGNAAAANADSLVYDVMAAFYTACGSFIGQNYGAGNKARVKKSYIVSLVYSFSIGTVMGILLVIFGHQFLALFTKEQVVAQAGMKRLTIMGFSYGISAFMDTSIAAARGLGKSLVPTIIVITGSCIFRIVWIYTIFDYFKTIPSLYLLYAFSWSFTAIAEMIYLKRIYKKQMAIFD